VATRKKSAEFKRRSVAAKKGVAARQLRLDEERKACAHDIALRNYAREVRFRLFNLRREMDDKFLARLIMIKYGMDFRLASRIVDDRWSSIIYMRRGNDRRRVVVAGSRRILKDQRFAVHGNVDDDLSSEALRYRYRLSDQSCFVHDDCRHAIEIGRECLLQLMSDDAWWRDRAMLVQDIDQLIQSINKLESGSHRELLEAIGDDDPKSVFRRAFDLLDKWQGNEDEAT
jgi:hypothetical protein